MIAIYEYKGGGYSGCWWEWNYIATHDDEFHNILSTGRKGIKSQEEFVEKLCSEAWVKDSKLSYYNLDIDDHHFELTDNTAASNVKMIDEYLRTNGMDGLHAHCWECGDVYNVEAMEAGNYIGDGWGTMHYGRDLYCETCAHKECEDDELESA